MCYRTGKYTAFEARPCIFQPGNFTGWGSEGVKVCKNKLYHGEDGKSLL